MRRIITVQHTESVHHTNGMIGSWTDWELTATGKEQAERIAKRLKADYPDVNFTLYSSDLKRAKQTAQAIGDVFGIPIHLSGALRERNLGRACGQSVQWLKDNIESHETDIDSRLFSDAETRREAWNRLKPFYDELLNQPHENIILVSHGDLLSLFNAMWLGLEPEFLNRADLYGNSGGVSLLLEKQGKRVIKSMSDMSYIRPNQE
ncbi:histidine phosphatase family protein [Streptococcus merionis]|uniref:Phosphoglycerate mutase family protein n=1 Tax=Streptococcus merionis TaxID=400065 RepID=A0A239SL11_9STRE|nr:histidine phosphatase family protein [Streptococcus merionis]SNU86091.1 phosphoglycerate mutase family protein [Streptococcus merionis]